VIRVTLGICFGIIMVLYMPALLGIESRWGVAGLTVSSGLCGWIEFSLLRRSLNRRIGRTGIAPGYLARLWGSAAAAAAAAWAVKLALGPLHPVAAAVAVLGTYGSAYFAAAYALGIAEARSGAGILIRAIKK
jgi:putative peptidoglycan lipid II flippase